MENSQLPDLRQFTALVAVHKTGSIAGAAKKLHLSVATVNYHLEKLEQAVGAPLISRARHGSTLTRAALAMLPDISATLENAAHTISSAQERKTAKNDNIIRIGAFPTAAAVLLPRIARRLKSTDIKMQTTLAEVGTISQIMQAGLLDIALSYTAKARSHPTKTKPHTTAARQHATANSLTTALLADPLLLAVPLTHRFAKLTRLSNKQLLECADESWISGTTPDDPVDEKIMRFYSDAGKPQNIKVQTDDYAVALGLVSAGLAIAIVPQLAVSKQKPAGVRLVSLEDPSFTRHIELLTNPRTLQNAPLNKNLSSFTTAVLAATKELRF
ncbi:LysR family transcriptional regulator [Canibacter sp. lx-72]|uniref:LysR family transcriptional regulator n=1 Tax=Canibacter zhuwentaonis TaxID=2837491 RepID=UPI001BDCC39C|nr:LysR family transcriptional regulator [Canibacter zhuwentaonis]MBT1017554.1 LysR family transcriptional regulator [Canibacter zhuwentaonis]